MVSKLIKVRKEFIDLNKKYWPDRTREKTGGYIYVNCNDAHPFYFPGHMLRICMYAKAIQEETGHDIIFIFNRENSIYRDEVKSFGISKMITLSNKKLVFKNIFITSISIFRTLLFFVNIKSPEDLLKLECGKVPIGHHMYDTFIRSAFANNEKQYTIEKVRFNLHNLKCVFSSYLGIEHLKIYYDKYPAKYYIGCHLCYQPGIYAGMAYARNAKVATFSANKLLYARSGTDSMKEMMRENIVYNMNAHVDKNNIILKMNEYLQKRFSGELLNIDVFNAYNKDMLQLDKLSFSTKHSLSDAYPTVFIMAHCFSDVPHLNSRLFNDYYEWIENTIRYVSDIKNVNWFIKAHPSRYLYREGNEVKEMVDKYNKGSLYYFDDRYNSKSVLDVVDVIVTANGTAGLEYSCMGVPIIIAGDPPYAGFGFTLEPKTKNDYYDLLKNVANIKKLTEEQVKTAKLVYYCYLELMDPSFKQGVYKSIADIYGKHAQGARKALAETKSTKEYEKSYYVNDEAIECIESIFVLYNSYLKKNNPQHSDQYVEAKNICI